MLATLLASLAFLSAVGPTGRPKPDLAAYEAARAKAGQRCRRPGQAGPLVRGPRARRRAAQAPDPRHADRPRPRHGAGPAGPGRPAAASGSGRRRSRSQIEDDPKAQAVLREYLERRANAPDRPDDQWKLARWCENRGLKEQAMAHYSRRGPARPPPRGGLEATRLQEDREPLGQARPARRREGRGRAAEARRQALAADPREHRDGLDRQRAGQASPGRGGAGRGHRSPRRRRRSGTCSCRGASGRQLAAVQILGQIDGPAASQCRRGPGTLQPLADGPRPRHRDPGPPRPARLLGRDPGPDPQAVQLRGPAGERPGLRRACSSSRASSTTSSGSIAPTASTPPRCRRGSSRRTCRSTRSACRTCWSPRDGRGAAPAVTSATAGQLEQSLAANPTQAWCSCGSTRRPRTTRRTRPFPPQPCAPRWPPSSATSRSPLGSYQAEQRAQEAQQRLVQDIQTVEATNVEHPRAQRPRPPRRETVTGQDFGADRDAWKAWWTDQLGYVYQSPKTQSKPTFTDVVVFSAEPPADALGLLRGRHPGPHDRRPAGDRVDPGRRPRAVAGHHHRRALVPAGRRRPPQQAGPDAPARDLTARPSSPPASTGSGRPARAGPWPATSSPATVRTVGGTAGSNPSNPTRSSRSSTSTSPRTANSSSGQHGCLVHDFSFVQPVMRRSMLRRTWIDRWRGSRDLDRAIASRKRGGRSRLATHRNYVDRGE